MESRHCQVNRQADARLASPIHHVQSDCITAYVCVCVCECGGYIFGGRRCGLPCAETLIVVINGASPETSHINFSTLENIADALTELPSRTRYAFEMYRLHGVQQKDIAKELGVSPTLVNFMIRDALIHCRKVSGSQPDTFSRR